MGNPGSSTGGGANCITPPAAWLGLILGGQAKLFGLFIREHIRFGGCFVLIDRLTPELVHLGGFEFLFGALEQRFQFLRTLLDHFRSPGSSTEQRSYKRFLGGQIALGCFAYYRFNVLSRCRENVNRFRYLIIAGYPYPDDQHG